MKSKVYQHYIKRLFDFNVSFIMLLILSPLLLVVTIWLYFENKGAGVFFYQKRPGKEQQMFQIVKFKTMNEERGDNGDLLPDHQRLTKVGKFLRSTSIDEIPQLINVFKGDMSLIGPRPLLMKYLPLYTKKQARRHEVRPGISGWAQVNGRNAISWNEKFKYDEWYVDHISLWLDIKIMFLTIKKVFVREGINSNANTTMEEFTGLN